MNPQYDVIILGAGPAGLTAGIYSVRAKLNTLILGDQPGGNSIMYEHIGNYPGFPGGVSGAQLMMNMVMQVDQLGVDRIVQNATGVSLEDNGIQVFTDDEAYIGKSLIVATGSRPISLDVPGEEEFQGIFYCAHCDAPVFKAMKKSRASVVGGGNSALYTAMYISRFAEEITVVHRGAALRADRRVQESALSNPKIKLQLNMVVKGISGEGGLVKAMILQDKESGDETEFETDGIFVGIGQRPNSYLVEGIVELDSDGFILVNRHMETSRDGIYAAGDVVQKPLRQIVTAVGDGAVAADSAIHYIEGQSG